MFLLMSVSPHSCSEVCCVPRPVRVYVCVCKFERGVELCGQMSHCTDGFVTAGLGLSGSDAMDQKHSPRVQIHYPPLNLYLRLSLVLNCWWKPWPCGWHTCSYWAVVLIRLMSVWIFNFSTTNIFILFYFIISTLSGTESKLVSLRVCLWMCVNVMASSLGFTFTCWVLHKSCWGPNVPYLPHFNPETETEWGNQANGEVVQSMRAAMSDRNINRYTLVYQLKPGLIPLLSETDIHCLPGFLSLSFYRSVECMSLLLCCSDWSPVWMDRLLLSD